MNRAGVIVDTNVVVAALLTANDASPVARILDGMLVAAFPFVLSQALLEEYHAVLGRSVLRKLHGLTVAEIELMLTDLVQNAIMLKSVEAPSAPDPCDQLLWNLLAARSSLVLVTGDKRLLRDVGMRGRVLSPAAFVSDSDLAGGEA